MLGGGGPCLQPPGRAARVTPWAGAVASSGWLCVPLAQAPLCAHLGRGRGRGRGRGTWVGVGLGAGVAGRSAIALGLAVVLAACRSGSRGRSGQASRRWREQARTATATCTPGRRARRLLRAPPRSPAAPTPAIIQSSMFFNSQLVAHPAWRRASRAQRRGWRWARRPRPPRRRRPCLPLLPQGRPWRPPAEGRGAGAMKAAAIKRTPAPFASAGGSAAMT
jgi:hypothetical protein